MAAQIILLKSIGSTTEASASLRDWFIAVWAMVPRNAIRQSQPASSSVGQRQKKLAAARVKGDRKIEA